METEKMKVLLYLKKSGLDKSGRAPIMGRITIGRSIAQFSCKLSCNPDLWNSRESRMDGKSREAVEINGRLENLLLSIQSAYQSLIAKGQPFDATDVKGLFQGSVQTRCMLIKEKESHIGINIKEGAIHGYHSTRIHLQKFIQRKYKVRDLAFSASACPNDCRYFAIRNGKVDIRENIFRTIYVIFERKVFDGK